MAEKTPLRLEAVLKGPSTRFNLAAAQLTEAAVKRGEGRFSSTGAFSTSTGKYTGRSPKDKFIVK
ncbi:MAG: phosphoenolpyruvate carboxykinase (ATP), partial [Limnochordia bacterium]|nr:phosphoenolpyruvate carboxykinase (ATP) [Limnochordia bacterium]